MVKTMIKKVFGSRNDRVIKQYRQRIIKINLLEPEFEKYSDKELAAKTEVLKKKCLASGVGSIIDEAFALVREASKRVLGMRHFDVQLIGGLVLNDGRIAEMGTGEGKTLVATLPAYLNALTGNPVHIVTVNDYLAKRDSADMGRIFEFLGLNVTCNLSNLDPNDKTKVYAGDIIYGTNNEFTFDYLRDNLVSDINDKKQGKLSYAIVDEVDSILIDEARTPLIISGQSDGDIELYSAINEIVLYMDEADYVISEKDKDVSLTEAGHENIENKLIENGFLHETNDLYGVNGLVLMHHINAAIKAHNMFNKDVDYLINEGKIVIIDEFTGRMMEGRQWSNGLHQAIEAKEGLQINFENETIASITYQNYFRIYDKLSGMTGTADTEAGEFLDIYSLEVITVPTNKPIVRIDEHDKIYMSKESKYKAVIMDVREANKKGQPVLVGTTNVDASEELSILMTKANIKHNILNAKNHGKEAGIIAEAGNIGAVTIATNMAGRGTDIKLGGLDERNREAVIASGGLRVVSSERQESRRLDNQLRGRSGRQGDKGSTCFYLSTEDDLMRIFGDDRVKSMVGNLVEDDEAIEHSLINRGIINAQKKIEAHNYDIRKQLLRYDDIASSQRKHAYEVRNNILTFSNANDYINKLAEVVITDVGAAVIPSDRVAEESEFEDIEKAFMKEVGFSVNYSDGYIEDMITTFCNANKQLDEMTDSNIMALKKEIVLNVLDRLWIEHLSRCDALRSGVGLRALAQKDPVQEYQKGSFESFEMMISHFKIETVRSIIHLHQDAVRQVEKINN